jgi:hypothetical protein
MTTFSDLKANIADDLNRTDLTTQINTRVLRAVGYYANKEFWFNRAQATASTVAGQELYALPTDFMAPYRMQLTDGTLKEPLVRVANNWLNAYFETETRSRPTHWSILANQIRLRPLPDAVYTLTLTYRKELTALSGASDTNAWTEDAEMLIHYRTCWDIYQHIIRDQGMAQACKASEMEQLHCLMRRNTEIVSAGRLNTELGGARSYNINYD